jgi:ABC-type lipoprotein export system ATPase subunit
MQPTLQMLDVWQQFQQGKETVTVLTGASYTFEQGTTYALTGVSGTGKSTILQLLAGLEQPTDGSVVYQNKALAQFSDVEHQHFLHATVGLVFQLPYLIDELSVRENVMLKGMIIGQSGEISERKADRLLEQVGLLHKANAYPAALSGGEQQRVALVRALFVQPQFLLADEPTAHLDHETKKLIISLILEFQESSGMGLIIATHDPEIAALMDKRVAIIDNKLVSD